MTASAARKKKHVSVARKKPGLKPTSSPEETAGDVPLPFRFWTELFDYQINAWQRGVLFWDALRQRADNILDHEEAGMPPPLAFKYETVMDARKFRHPCNYALLKILETKDGCLDDCLDPEKPPVVIVDPRAGHGPGIGGFKRDSEVGIAMHEGYPVYFVSFFPDPEPHQHIADVMDALRRFVEKVSQLHDGRQPILYGNCQAGWLIALLSAHCCKGETIPGLAVMNGSPLSYWATGNESNPMQVLGGLSGGAWLARYTADLTGGILDGAWMVQNFENLNPAQAVWEKYHNLYARPEDERDRFLAFERWWNGYYRFSEEEITETVANLFIGDKLERGEMRLHESCTVKLEEIRHPLFIFASEGDDITPPRQALHWMRAVYPDTKALKAAKQRIVYMINEHVGHLGIFVSASVARLEHRAILEHADDIENLAPGLYEMIIDNPTGNPDCRHDQYDVRFEERKIEELCDIAPQDPFETVRRVSEENDDLYRGYVQPWIKLFTMFNTPDMLMKFHPLRLRRVMFSERLNPFMIPLMVAADAVRTSAHGVSDDNPFLLAEHWTAEQTATAIETVTRLLDDAYAAIYENLYG